MPGGSFGPRRLTIELTNICNLHCSYCLRDDEALYHSPSEFLSAEFLERVIHEARDVMGVSHLVFTGGEPTLHPEFARLLDIGAANGLTMALVTNGWHFERIWPSVLAHRNSIASVGFSIDGVTRESHDYWRGEGSFVRLVRAFARCHAYEIPFAMKIAIRRDTAANLEQIAMFAARLGAASLNFTHVMPTSAGEEASSLSLQERRLAEQEIANLSRIFKMKIGIDVGYYNLDPSPPCSPLAGASANIDYVGRLTLCCNLSGFRGAAGQAEIIADLNVEHFSTAFARLSTMASRQLEARRKHLAMLAKQGITPDLYSGSPCLFCLESLGKVPWRQTAADLSSASRSLPVLMSS